MSIRQGASERSRQLGPMPSNCQHEKSEFAAISAINQTYYYAASGKTLAPSPYDEWMQLGKTKRLHGLAALIRVISFSNLLNQCTLDVHQCFNFLFVIRHQFL